ncbi:MAG: cytochrome c oxidase subunit 3 [Alphaproteobacteria bacterium]|nr:cytochrome c oxidase subunit 3 [Alphaproteobacteria bacterium]
MPVEEEEAEPAAADPPRGEAVASPTAVGDPPDATRGLTGGTALWILMTVEVATFGMFFLWFASSWHGHVEVYAASQAQLDVRSGFVGTVLLLAGSWLAYEGVLAHEDERNGTTARSFLAASAVGCLFTVNKLAEYAAHAGHGVSLSTNGFWFAYLFLTGLHLLHVLAGVVALAVLGFRALRGAGLGREDTLSVEATAGYWHLVDVIWLFLFPLLYLVQP